MTIIDLPKFTFAYLTKLVDYVFFLVILGYYYQFQTILK